MIRAGVAFGRIPIRWKLVVIMLGVVAISLVLASVGLLRYERAAFERETEHKLVLLADVVGLNSTAALAFNDSAAAAETLTALSSDEHVIAAGLYGNNGRLFARYLRRGADQQLPDVGPTSGRTMFAEGQVALVRIINLKGQPVGKMYLLADTTAWGEILGGFVGIVAMLFVAILTFGLFVSIWLQRVITNPITDLAQLTRRIGQERDYSLRAVARGDDELGVLVRGFNDMLDEIVKGRAEIEHAHEVMRRLNEELEERVHRRTEQLEIANKELEAFSYSVSHDLRAPLRSIDGFSRILLDDHAAALDAGARDCLDRVRNAAQHMSALIDDLLMLARVTRTEPVHEEVDLTALARQVSEALQAQAPERRVAFILAPGLKVRGDPRLMRIALENLIGNAWKFTSGRAEARIEIGAKTDSETPVYFVRDNGAGFDMTYAGKLFTPFQRLHMAEEFPGTGIGLATVQRIMHKHNGRVWGEGAVDQGATFYFMVG